MQQPILRPGFLIDQGKLWEEGLATTLTLSGYVLKRLEQGGLFVVSVEFTSHRTSKHDFGSLVDDLMRREVPVTYVSATPSTETLLYRFWNISSRKGLIFDAILSITCGKAYCG